MQKSYDSNPGPDANYVDEHLPNQMLDIDSGGSKSIRFIISKSVPW